MKLKQNQPALWPGRSLGLGIAALRRWCETWAADTGTTWSGTSASRAGEKTENRDEHRVPSALHEAPGVLFLLINAEYENVFRHFSGGA